MMWYVDFLIDQLGAFGAQDPGLHTVFACLALGAGFGLPPRISAVLTALVHLYLALS